MKGPQSFVEASVPVQVPLRLLADLPEGPGPFPVLLGLHGYAMRAKPFLGLMRQLAPEGFLLVSMQGLHSAECWQVPLAGGLLAVWKCAKLF